MLIGLDDFQGALALQRPERVRHRHLRKHGVVPAGRRLGIAVEGAKVGVEPVGAARAADHAEVRRRGAEHGLAVFRGKRHFHGVADLGIGEDQVVEDLGFGKAKIGEPVVAHELRAMAVEAVVDESARARLQAEHVLRIGRRVVEPVAGFGRVGGKCGNCRDEEQRGKEFLHGAAHIVTRSGSGLHLSIAVYQGIRKKNAK